MVFTLNGWGLTFSSHPFNLGFEAACFICQMKNAWVLRLCTALVFFGRAYQHVFWDAPFRTLLWDQSLMEPLVLALGAESWNDFATNPSVDAAIQNLVLGFGLAYALLGILALFIHKKHRWAHYLLCLGALALAFLAFLYCKEKFFHLGQFFEYAIQIVCPLLLFLHLRGKAEGKGFQIWLYGALALTFVCHGLYAFGYYPRPGKFVDMSIKILDISEAQAHLFLYWAGVLDFIVAAILFIPKTRVWALLYMVFWGGLTAMARLVSAWDWANLGPALHQNIADMVYRLPHGLLPFFALMPLANAQKLGEPFSKFLGQRESQENKALEA